MQLLTNINQEIVRKAELEPERYHLGGSQIGDKCLRKLVYGFRKAKRTRFNGRMHRLFNRGHEEEFRFVRWLRNANLEVREYAERLVYHEPTGEYATVPWDEEVPPECVDCSQDEAAITIARIQNEKLLKQWRITGYRGHFSGSLDGMAKSDEDQVRDSYMSDNKVHYTTSHFIPKGEWFLLEFKTHNFKSFTKLVDAKSVKIIKLVHYAQMQVYMHYRKLKFALYCAVNKNDDDLYFEIVPYNEQAALAEINNKAVAVIDATKLPDRMPGASPALFDCKYCDYNGCCHRGEPLERSCRSCHHVRATDEQTWTCTLWNNVIPLDFVLKGCDKYSSLRD